MENRAESLAKLEPIFPHGLVSSREKWDFFMSPRIQGKSGNIHEFDFAFCLRAGRNLLVLGKKYSSVIRNGLAALTFFNAQCDDVGAFRKVMFCEKELSPEEKLLANALKIDVLKELSDVNQFLSFSLNKEPEVGSKKLDVGAILSLEKESKNEKSRKKYRDRTRLIQEVLSSASVEDGTTLNNIVFKCNLNYNSARKIVEDLIKKELLGIEINGEEKTVYTVTGSGHKMIERLRHLDGVNSND